MCIPCRRRGYTSLGAAYQEGRRKGMTADGPDGMARPPQGEGDVSPPSDQNLRSDAPSRCSRVAPRALSTAGGARPA
eukprot:scaffold1077_cov388-Prasinococcus_capsulatus_cf.AAC.15